MEKFVKKKKLFMGLMVLLLLLGCGNSAESKGNNLVLKANDYSLEKDEYQNVPYLNHKDVFQDKNNNQKPVGKYSNTTPDGKINWNVEGDIEYEQTPIAKDMFDKITLDGKKIKLPMKFDDLGEDYKEFKNMDYSKLKYDMAPITIRNKKNNYASEIVAVYLYPEYPEFDLQMSIFKKNNFLIGVDINVKNNLIIGLNNRDLARSMRELKVDGIGIGNTFNEMYAKFGKPCSISIDNYDKDIWATYYYEDNKKNGYYISFINDTKINNNKTKQEEKTKPNVITTVSVSLIEDIKDNNN